MKRAWLQYTLVRLLVFGACVMVLWLIPVLRENVLWLLLAATTLSMLISLFALAGMRDRMSMEIADRVEERHLRRAHAFDDEVIEAEEEQLGAHDADMHALHEAEKETHYHEHDRSAQGRR